MLVLGNLLLQAAPAGAEVSVQSGGQCGHKLHPVHTRRCAHPSPHVHIPGCALSVHIPACTLSCAHAPPVHLPVSTPPLPLEVDNLSL